MGADRKPIRDRRPHRRGEKGSARRPQPRPRPHVLDRHTGHDSISHRLPALLAGSVARPSWSLRHPAAIPHGRDIHGIHERHVDCREDSLVHTLGRGRVRCDGTTTGPRCPRGNAVKLAVFTSRYPAQVATFFERDMRSLVDAGIEIDVFSVAPFDPSLWKHALPLLGRDQLPRDRVYHLSVLESMRGGIKTLLRNPTARRDARAILTSATRYGLEPFAKTAYVLPKAWTWAEQAREYDHVLAYWGNYAGTCAYAFHRLAMPHAPFSLWLHAGSDLYFDTVFLRQKLLYADNIITCCEFNVRYLTQEFADVMPQIASKIHVSHHGLDLSAFAFRPEGRPANRVIAVGRLAKEKGYDYLVRAAQVLAKRGVDVQVDFVGHGRDEPRLVALTRELGISDQVRFRGWLPFAEVRTAMTEATVLVHPSNGLGDGLPNVIREAMAVGTPVIASDVAGIPDALNDGCGVLVPPKDVDALATAIADVLADPVRRAEMARRARQRVEQHYDLSRNGARLAQVLKSTPPRSEGKPVPVRS